MTQYLVVIGFFIVAIGIFAFGLWFSNYKQNGKGGCGGESCYCAKSNFVDEYGNRIGEGNCKNKDKKSGNRVIETGRLFEGK